MAGQLCVGGVSLAQGYLHRPRLTAEKFLADPFSQHPGARLYVTGDLGRYLPSGDVEFLGRRDDQVKIRGLRVELGEVEAALSEHPAVQAAVVTVREPFSNHSLVTHVVSAAGLPLTGDELRGFLERKLPDYMVPSRFVFLEALPLTPSGKVDSSGATCAVSRAA